ncbi:MAG: hypothetical protein ACM3X9_07815 [Bacillota bacterium]
MDRSEMTRPVQLSDTYYYGIQPTISRVAAEMDDMSVAYPTQGMFDPMLDRVYDEVAKMYPEEMQASNSPEQNQNAVNAQAAYDNPKYHANQFFPPFRRRLIAKDLLAILLLQELLGRRRRFFR